MRVTSSCTKQFSASYQRMRHLIVGMKEPSLQWFGICKMRKGLFALLIVRKKTHESVGHVSTCMLEIDLRGLLVSR